MNWYTMDNSYHHSFKRLDKLRKTLEQLVAQNEALSETNKELRVQHDTDIRREAARERVFKSLTKENTISLESME